LSEVLPAVVVLPLLFPPDPLDAHYIHISAPSPE
jgi:hypothetical protein